MIRRIAQSVHRMFREPIRQHRFFRTLHEFRLLDPEAPVQRKLLDELVKYWDNDWSAQSEYLEAILQRLSKSSDSVLECGSGLTSIVVGLRCSQLGRQLWSLEHDPVWANRIERMLCKLSIEAATILRAPLIDRGHFDWYDLAALPPDLIFGLVICDGPPGSTRGGRYGLFPSLAGRMSRNCTVLLDDAARPDECRVLGEWQAHYGVSWKQYGESKPFAVVNGPSVETRGIS